MGRELLILGAGVSGLSTGILLLKKGFKITIWAKDIPPHTTSNKAAAVWYPFLCGSPHEATNWGKSTLDFFKQEVLREQSSGCKKTTVVEIFTDKKADPWWREGVESYKRISTEKLPVNYIDGYEIEGLVMDTDIYMNYLVHKFKSLGGEIVLKELTDITEAFKENAIVINCTGLGSRALLQDTNIYPTRGQIIKVKPNGLDYSLFEQEGPNSLAYIIPRYYDIVLGGTAQKNDWNEEISETDTIDILKRCSSILPKFKKVEIIDIKVGLRPTRNKIRLEIEQRGNNTIIHNYGHGGAGFTLSWGCAQNVVGLVESIFSAQNSPLIPVINENE